MTNKDYSSDITEIFTVIDNYGTAAEAREAILALLRRVEVEAIQGASEKPKSGNKPSGKQVDTLLDAAIRSAVMSQYIYSKAHFDNAKDTRALLAAAQEGGEMLINAVKYRVADRIEQLLLAKVEDMVGRGEAVLRVGNKLYRVTDLASERLADSEDVTNPPSRELEAEL